ncbi:MAG: hypothetical protein E7617_02315 [Ruminococcaceae bacterium]|nr:hypothetical protein [Oscillospiraceae bacterium]
MDERDVTELEFTYRPVTDKKRAFPLLFTVVGVSSLLVAISTVVDTYRGLLSLLGVMGLTVATYILTRYTVSEFAYSVMATASDELMLVVTKTVGKRVTTLYSTKVKGIKSIQLFTKDEYKKHKTEKGRLLYNLAPSFSPASVYIAIIDDAEEKSEIILECTEAVVSRLLECRDYAVIQQKERYEATYGSDEE